MGLNALQPWEISKRQRVRFERSERRAVAAAQVAASHNAVQAAASERERDQARHKMHAAAAAEEADARAAVDYGEGVEGLVDRPPPGRCREAEGAVLDGAAAVGEFASGMRQNAMEYDCADADQE